MNALLLLAGTSLFLYVCNAGPYVAVLPLLAGAYWCMLDAQWQRLAGRSEKAAMASQTGHVSHPQSSPAGADSAGPHLDSVPDESCEGLPEAPRLVRLSTPPDKATMARLVREHGQATCQTGPAERELVLEHLPMNSSAHRWTFTEQERVYDDFTEDSSPRHDAAQERARQDRQAPKAAPAENKNGFEQDFQAWLASQSNDQASAIAS